MVATQYQKLRKKVEDVAEHHPNSFVILDSQTLEVLGTGANLEKIFSKVRKNLKQGQTPVIYKEPQKDEIRIL